MKLKRIISGVLAFVLCSSMCCISYADGGQSSETEVEITNIGVDVNITIDFNVPALAGENNEPWAPVGTSLVIYAADDEGGYTVPLYRTQEDVQNGSGSFEASIGLADKCKLLAVVTTPYGKSEQEFNYENKIIDLLNEELGISGVSGGDVLDFISQYAENLCINPNIGTPEEIEENSKGLDISKAEIINPFTYEKTEEYLKLFVELRKSKGLTYEEAKKTALGDYMYYACLMVKAGDADGVVSGACHSTANTLRPSLQIIKTKPGVKLVSAFFLMVVPDCEYGADGTFIFADSGLEQNPDPEKLAAIAACSAESFELLVEKEAVVAMLSHSTKGSAKHPDVDKVVAATEICKAENPNLKVDGELQLDAAIVPSVGASKAPESQVAGKANVLVFPDLDAGNIGYKLVQRLAKAEAYGPVTQGIAMPINDLSRGCSADDIVGVVAITCVQAQGK